MGRKYYAKDAMRTTSCSAAQTAAAGAKLVVSFSSREAVEGCSRIDLL